MAKEDSNIKLLVTRVRQLILQYKEVKKENDELYVLVEERDNQITALKEELDKVKSEYNTLKLAKMIEVTDGDLEGAKKRISKLVRDVNQCITLLSEK